MHHQEILEVSIELQPTRFFFFFFFLMKFQIKINHDLLKIHGSLNFFIFIPNII